MKKIIAINGPRDSNCCWVRCPCPCFELVDKDWFVGHLDIGLCLAQSRTLSSQVVILRAQRKGVDIDGHDLVLGSIQ